MIGQLTSFAATTRSTGAAGNATDPFPVGGAKTIDGTAFGEILNSLAGSLKEGEAASIAGMQGTVPLQTVVERILEAERSLQTGLAVRDKLVSAYLEVTRMQI